MHKCRARSFICDSCKLPTCPTNPSCSCSKQHRSAPPGFACLQQLWLPFFNNTRRHLQQCSGSFAGSCCVASGLARSAAVIICGLLSPGTQAPGSSDPAIIHIISDTVYSIFYIVDIMYYVLTYYILYYIVQYLSFIIDKLRFKRQAAFIS